MKSAAGTELPHPPARADYERAVASLALLGGPTPPKTITVGPRPGDGTTGTRQDPPGRPRLPPGRRHRRDRPRDRHRDEGFPERHKALYEECASRVDAGRGNPDEMSFVPPHRRRLDEQPIAVAFAAARLDSTAAALTAAEEAHAAAVAAHDEVTAT